MNKPAPFGLYKLDEKTGHYKPVKQVCRQKMTLPTVKPLRGFLRRIVMKRN